MKQADEDFLRSMMQERILQNFQAAGGYLTQAEKEASIELSKRYEATLRELPPEQAQIIKDYHEDLFLNSGKGEEFNYMSGLKDGLLLHRLLDELTK